jgi:hypothetical protein
MDLPAEYCMTRFKDMAGNDVIEFNLAYFNSITDKTTRKETLAVYPKVISKAYREWQAGKRTS